MIAPVVEEDRQLFGLRIRSEIPLPDLVAAEGQRVPDIIIRLGMPASVTEDGLRRDGDDVVLHVPHVGRYRMARGAEIVVSPAPDVPARNLRLFLLGSAFGVLLHQRGLLPLHANAVEVEGKAFAFMGESGSGKSTLAAWFLDRGYRVLADDVCVVGFEEGKAVVMPGLPRLRLWRDAMERTNRTSDHFERSYAGATPYEKFDVPVRGDMVSSVELGAIFLLDRGVKLRIVPLDGLERAEAVFANTYRGEFISEVQGEKAHWAASTRLASGPDFFRLIRPWDTLGFDHACEEILTFITERSCGAR